MTDHKHTTADGGSVTDMLHVLEMTARLYLWRQMCTQEPGNPVRGQDGTNRRSVFWVYLEHLFEQKLKLVGQMPREGRVRTPAYL